MTYIAEKVKSHPHQSNTRAFMSVATEMYVMLTGVTGSKVSQLLITKDQRTKKDIAAIAMPLIPGMGYTDGKMGVRIEYDAACIWFTLLWTPPGMNPMQGTVVIMEGPLNPKNARDLASKFSKARVPKKPKKSLIRSFH